MYQSAEEARAILGLRRRDLGLRRRVRDYLGELPDFLRHGPRAVLTRQLATPNLEFGCFAAGAKQVGLVPAALDYLADSFCARNPDKLALAKMTFHHGRGRQQGDKTSSCRIIDCDRSEGQPIVAIRTFWGESLVDFHHRLLAERFPAVEVNDCSAWLHRLGGKPSLFWPRVLALFICDGILFENFHSAGQETTFNRTIIRPALAHLEERFGLPPLIVPLVPPERERERFWSWYPGDLAAGVMRSLATHPRPAAGPQRPAVPARGGSHG